MRAHVLQHAPLEGPGNIVSWLIMANACITYTRFFDSPDLPKLDEIDLLIVLGGPMSLSADSEFPWLTLEKRFVREAIDRGIAVLGVGMGAQLIAASKGAKVYPAPQREIGWYPVNRTDIRIGAFNFPMTTQVLHWHSETFDLPKGAVHLATSSTCANQAFQLGERVIGVQFHLEIMPLEVEALLMHRADELGLDEFIELSDQIRAQTSGCFKQTNELMYQILNYITRGRTSLN